VSGGAPARKGAKSRTASARRSTGRRKAGDNADRDRAARQAVEVLFDRLRERYGEPRPESYQPPLDELVFTILSQNTTDTNRDRAWASLWQRFDSWEEVAAARVDTIAAAIKVGGLHKVKARRIKDILKQVEKQNGGFDLDNLADLDVDAARAALGSYKGIGDKSVNCILLFSLGLPAFPVDTHVHRIFRRLGILETKDLGKANRDAQRLVADEIAYPLHINVIRYGREVCHAQRPKCWDCNIVDLCAYEPKNLEP
jgi:endonuclease-3